MASFVVVNDWLHENGASAIVALQNRFPEQEALFSGISKVLDPRYVYLVYIPLLFSVDRASGKKLVWATVLTEWLEQILKWLLGGERPYWWVHETVVYGRRGSEPPFIRQFPLTCETGPGSPSGHVIFTIVIWHILFQAILKNKARQGLAHLCWSIHWLMVLCSSLSRVYLAAHFPHQCLQAIIVGVILVKLVDKLVPIYERMNLYHYVLSTLVLLASSVATFLFLRHFGSNPMSSMENALKWCSNQQHVHLDTTLFFGVARSGGFLLGAGLAFNNRLLGGLRSKTRRWGLQAMLLEMVLSLAIVGLYQSLPLPKDDIWTLYGLAFFLNALLSYLLLDVVPYSVARLTLRTMKIV